jgi:hypothetical protein
MPPGRSASSHHVAITRPSRDAERLGIALPTRSVGTMKTSTYRSHALRGNAAGTLCVQSLRDHHETQSV